MAVKKEDLVGIEGNLSYDPDTGLFRYLTHKGRKNKDLVVTSKDSHGYIRVSYKGKRYLGHRVAFYLMRGIWPVEDVDHIDGDRLNNKWSNLRVASRSQNLHNQKCTRGKSQYKGVTKHQKGWVAQIGRGVDKYIGSYTDEREAGLAYNYSALNKFGKFARFNQVFEDMPQEVLGVEV
jgi:hypothetical protein